MKSTASDQTPLAAPSQKWLDAQHELARQADATPPPASAFTHPTVVTPADWLEARRELLCLEKEFTRQRDALAARQRALPWVKVAKPYAFAGPAGRVSLPDLFAGRSQLIVQHFMFGPGWEEGCKSCSFMLDHLNPVTVHLQARDVAFAVISHAPLQEILPFQRRMGWTVNWVSAHGTDFNADFHVSFPAEAVARGKVDYNYSLQEVPNQELPGISVFTRGGDGAIYHTYSTYGRGVELVMTTYDLLDLVPRGRDEAGLDYGMAWVRHHDRYDHATPAQ
ncbi:hypothetical protein Verru16b_00198 [Lacunisphaera limnophila]|uniref:Thioredoxin domain-containing protein n=1 Tax=Lacunisphaera limnophila TaxID=1838286 RepID=A0A1I7PHR5_9BACT|nr:DUF899 domain-containing protein [Lacunisphaera limnophila]AOS43157.1 hypothetical protein Verru16b_00198 [Lacunisphaera limnophila]